MGYSLKHTPLAVLPTNRVSPAVPIVYRCRTCGFILHVFVKVGQNSYGIPTPSELSSQFGGICPRCGSMLNTPTLNDIVIKPNGPQELIAVLEEAKRSMRISFRSLERYLAELRHTIRVHTNVEAPSSTSGSVAIEA
ncbi:hypothetical protein Pyrde_1305 [Pyrodictium delaneyi]|uniref:Uncharacterized protein n=1 Tax=Pyrodictium delaneyi TaxID=1273541 RepID=A0A0P0N4H7_9CREN|nr:hypothetical protein Pyrde_1305 [Pyrodictium delaneyi]